MINLHLEDFLHINNSNAIILHSNTIIPAIFQLYDSGSNEGNM